MRGKACNNCPRADIGGIIPAHAGKSLRRDWKRILLWDHPRSCGEKAVYTWMGQYYEGSSPLVRGKESRRKAVYPYLGIIPARAGKSSQGFHKYQNPRDHPRSCGEKNGGVSMQMSIGGSSPLVRGKVSPWGLLYFHRRIIPARAGKSWLIVISIPSFRDHPRSCGEKERTLASNLALLGSSPLVRGKGQVRFEREFPGRIIPARAGKSARSIALGAAARDHPRSCGEKKFETL